MIQLINKLLKITALMVIAVIVVSFTNVRFALDGGMIINPNIVITANAAPPEITATTASGCTDTVHYQWQQSPDGNSFIDIPNAIGVSYQAQLILAKTHFRRKAICSGDTAYTNNTATIIIQ